MPTIRKRKRRRLYDNLRRSGTGKVEEIKNELGEKTKTVYEEAKTYHDGKWVIFPPDGKLLEDYMRLLVFAKTK